MYQNGEVLKEWNRKQHEDNQVVTMTMTIAEFPDGTAAWLKYLTDNLNYPRALKKEKVSGKVIVKVSIYATGTVSNVEIIKSLHPLLDEEVIRVIKNSPTWKPAMQNGRNVQYTFNQAVNF
ncbi:energy transducer TonB [Parasediminibacterium paludis]|uniref:Energy transducer TonB n=1 Tax=Parasediminibacterium paludis TaxID=908966 RepID=A0ABV8PVN8_9BACT